MLTLTMKDLMAHFKQPWVVCYGLMEVLHSAGVATRVGYKKGAAGRPHIIWQTPRKIVLDLYTGEVTVVTEEAA